MKLKGLTIIQIILGIISIIGISILLTSVSNFIYYIFINNFNIEEYFFNNTVKSITLDEVKEAYNLLIDYVILESEFKNGIYQSIISSTQKKIPENSPEEFKKEVRKSKPEATDEDVERIYNTVLNYYPNYEEEETIYIYLLIYTNNKKTK